MKLGTLTDLLHRLIDREPVDAGLHRVSRPSDRPDATVALGPWSDREDTVAISSEAVFRFAAASFDPRRLTTGEARRLVALLHDGGAISSRDRSVLVRGIEAPDAAPGLLDAPDIERNLLAEFQERHARDMGRGDLAGMETSGRALAVLGRLGAQRAIAD